MPASAAVLALLTSYACTQEPAATEQEPSFDAGDAGGVRRDAQAEDAGREQPPLGPVDKEGWATWNAYDADCNLRIAVTPEGMPAPIEWVPCPELDETRGLDCRLMAPRGVTGRYYLVRATRGTSPNGPIFAVRWPSHAAPTETALFEADGPARFAIRGWHDCIDNDHGVGGGHHVFSVVRRRSETGSTGAIARAVLGEEPRVSDRYDDAIAGVYPRALPSGVLVGGELLDWAREERHALIFDHGRHHSVRSETYTQVGEHYLVLGGQDQLVFHRFGGAPRDLLSMGVYPPHAVGAFATDGQHVVWEELSEDETRQHQVEKRYVAPFSLDPSTYIASRRELYVTPGSWVASDLAVSCGHSARQTRPVDDAQHTRAFIEITRLVDGHRARIAQGAGWNPTTVLTLTCDEVFVRMSLAAENNQTSVNIARFRLDALDFQPPPG